jgi:hypothetical protein
VRVPHGGMRTCGKIEREESYGLFILELEGLGQGG